MGWPGDALERVAAAGGGGLTPPLTPLPLCDIPSGCCSFTGPWTVTRSSLRMLRRVAAFCRPLRPVLLLVSFPRSRIPVVGVLPPPPPPPPLDPLDMDEDCSPWAPNLYCTMETHRC